jgi:hypothetical protein
MSSAIRMPACAEVAGAIRELQRFIGLTEGCLFSFLSRFIHTHAKPPWSLKAAPLQGNFSEMHDLLYQKQASWSQS